MNPVALVTTTFMRAGSPHLPRGLPGFPELVQVLEFPVGVHGVEEAVVLVCDELLVLHQSLHRVAFEDAVGVVTEITEDLTVEHEEAGAHLPVELRLLGEAEHAATAADVEDTEARAGPHRRHCGNATMAA